MDHIPRGHTWINMAGRLEGDGMSYFQVYQDSEEEQSINICENSSGTYEEILVKSEGKSKHLVSEISITEALYISINI